MDLGLEESNGLISTVLMLMTIDDDAVDDEYNLAESHLIWRKVSNLKDNFPSRFLASPDTKDSTGCSSELDPRLQTTVKGERPGAGLREEGPANLCIRRGEFWVFRLALHLR